MALRSLVLLLFVAATGLAGSCDTPPRDPEGTLERVRGGVLRAGVTENPPWTILLDEGPVGVEVRLVEQFAAELDASIEWFEGSEQTLFGALKHGELDIVIGGLEHDNPFIKEAALTYPYLTTRAVVAVPSAEQIPDDIAGLTVAVEKGTEEAGLLEKTDARVQLVDDIAAAGGARVVDDWLLDDLGLIDTGVTLSEAKHVMAVRLGENGWMVELEGFLLDRTDEIQDMLDDGGAP